MAFFGVDFTRVVRLVVPVRLRKAVLIGWLEALTAPVRYVQGLFDANRAANVYLLEHNSQVCRMEAVLNDAFDETDRRIFISDLYRDRALYVALISEVGGTAYTSPVSLGIGSEAGAYFGCPTYLYTIGESVYSGYDFIVNVPSGLLSGIDLARLGALVERYKLPAKSWTAVGF